MAAWRGARAVLWMVFDSVETDSRDSSYRAATSVAVDPWPWELPSLLTGDDFVQAAAACAALARWCDDAARALGERQDATDAGTAEHELLAALAWHMATSAEQLDAVAHLLSEGSRGAWDRATAVWLADELAQRLTELCGSEWP